MNDVANLVREFGGLLAGIAALVTAVGIYLQQRRNGQKADDARVAAELARIEAEDAKKVLVETADGIREVGKAIDGRLTALLAAKEAEFDANVKRARAEGRAEGEQAERDRRAEPQP